MLRESCGRTLWSTYVSCACRKSPNSHHIARSTSTWPAKRLACALFAYCCDLIGCIAITTWNTTCSARTTLTFLGYVTLSCIPMSAAWLLLSVIYTVKCLVIFWLRRYSLTVVGQEESLMTLKCTTRGGWRFVKTHRRPFSMVTPCANLVGYRIVEESKFKNKH